MPRRALAALAALWLWAAAPLGAQEEPERFVSGRFTVLAFAGDAVLARNLLEVAEANDTFPGLPRPHEHVTIELAPDDARFRTWTGDQFPEWGAAAAFPETQRIVMHGHRAGSGAGNPIEVLRHELAHLALGEFMGDLPPRWFDEGYASYAAREWGREEVLATNVALAFRGPTTFAALDSMFYGGETRATAAYALAYRAIAELASMDPRRGLTVFFSYWRDTQSMDAAVRRAYGVTLDGYEDRWRSGTRRRYGVLALVTDVSLVGGVIGLVVLPVFLSRRRRQRRRLESLRFNEAQQERRARESALDALLSGTTASRDPQLLDTLPDDL